MALTIFIVVAVILLFAAAFVLLRTVAYGPSIGPVDPIQTAPVDSAVAAEHLSAALKLKTISKPELSPNDRKAFFELHKLLEGQYPRIHSQLNKEIVNEYSLLYTWVGKNPDLEPILIAAHQDVVPVEEAAAWTQPPFKGHIEDGFIWGRGALDNKHSLIAVMEAVENLLKKNYQPERTVYLAFGHDEELGGQNGAFRMAEKLKELGVHLATVIDEGGVIADGVVPGTQVPVALVGTAEKGYLSLELCVEGQAGHSSTPPQATAIGVLAKALARLEANPLPAKMSLVKPMFKAMAPALPFSMQIVFANTWLLGGVVRKRLISTATTAATIRTTTAITMINAGIKDNCLPSEAKAVVNFRLIPGDTIGSVCEKVRKLINDKRVTFQPLENNAWDPTPVSPIDSLAYRTLSTTIRQVFDGIPVAPYLTMGATDSRHYYPICDHVYRFSPVKVNPVELASIHGKDERIEVEALAQMVSFYTTFIRNWEPKENKM